MHHLSLLHTHTRTHTYTHTHIFALLTICRSFSWAHRRDFLITSLVFHQSVSSRLTASSSHTPTVFTKHCRPFCCSYGGVESPGCFCDDGGLDKREGIKRLRPGMLDKDAGEVKSPSAKHLAGQLLRLQSLIASPRLC